MDKPDYSPCQDQVCAAISDADEALTREVISRLADKWTLWTLAVLEGAGGPLRFSRLRALVEGISQKSLTKTLRQMERDGLVTRTVFAEVPPRVEYRILPIGSDILARVQPLWTWAAQNAGHFRTARAAFDKNHA